MQSTLTVQKNQRMCWSLVPLIDPNGGQHMWLTEDMVNDTIYIPAWWHNCITIVDQQFDSMKKVKLALIYYYIVKKFMYDFVKKDKRRITVNAQRKTTGCA